MSVGAEQYQGSVNIRLEEINNCGDVLNDLAIPGRISGCLESISTVGAEAARKTDRKGRWLRIPHSRLCRAPE
jgi:hypothetical protein